CCFKSLFLYDIDNLSRVLEQVATLKHRSSADLCAVVSAAIFRCASRNVFNNLRSKIVPLLEKNEFYAQASMMLTIEIINGEKSDWNTAQKAIDLAEKLATEEKNSREGDFKAMGYYMLAASWAMAIDDFPRKDILFGKFTKILYEILQTKEESKQDFEWPDIKKGPIRINRAWSYGTSSSLSEAASWARQMGYFQEQNELLKRALEFAIEQTNKEEKAGNFTLASRTLAQAADFAEKMGDEKLRKELYAKAIDLRLKCPEEGKEETLISGPSFYYAQAADFAEKIWDKKLRSEFYETAIDLRVRYAEEKEKEENYSEALKGYAE
ncbi:MAG: hypothetical protein IMF19_11055, partial [Proteobacteria bacterium]|nr:hypothetical protein [Pseudomonadota bacterium]